MPFIEDWAGISVKGKVMLSNLWVMGTGPKAEFGIVCVLTDAMQLSQPFAFPF